MYDYKYQQVDFDNPSIPFIIEDWLKYFFGDKIFYKSHFESIGINGNENILDFGCGGGAGSKLIAGLLNNNGQLFCIDASKYWADKARKRLNKFQNVKVLCGDIRNINLPDNYFDIILIFHVIHDIRPEERQETLNTLKNKLKDLGKIFVVEPVKFSHGMSPKELELLMLNSGLEKLNSHLTIKEYKGEFRLIK